MIFVFIIFTLCSIQLIESNQNSHLINKIKFNKTQKHNGYEINKLGNCKAQLDDGSFIDLTSLDNPGNPRKDTNGGYTYLWNPCSSFKCGNRDAAVCQSATNGQLTYVLGEQSTVAFSQSGSDTILAYKSTTESRGSYITCSCGDSESFVFVREAPGTQYYMRFTSKCCCPNGCKDKPKPKPSKGGLGVGSILLIIFFCGLLVYLIFGALFLKFVKQRQGTDIIPNFSLWKEVPGNIKSGVSFTVSKVTSKGGYSQL